MKAISVRATALAVLVTACSAYTDGRIEIVPASQVKWEQLNPARGDKSPQAGTLWGDRKGAVPTGFFAKFAVGFASPPQLPLMDGDGRVINLSSAAQAPVDPAALAGEITIGDDFAAYAQSKLAVTMWSRHMALACCGDTGPAIIAVNPGSMLGSKMVKEAFGSTGEDIQIGAEILSRAALSDAFSDVSGPYFDNDSGRFASPHPDGLDPHACAEIARVVETIIGG